MISREVKILSVSFMFIFLGYTSVQQYVTTFFSKEGLVGLGFISLFFVYLFFTLFIPISTMIVGKIGSKNSMIIASIFYSTFILSLITKNYFIIYLFSCFLGIAAALLWSSQPIHLIKSTNKNFYGKNAGFFVLMSSLGAVLGLNILGFLAKKYSLQNLFFIFSIFPFIGFVLLFKLKNFKPKRVNKLVYFKKAVQSKTILKITFILFSLHFIQGLIIGLVPISINDILGVAYVGVLSSSFYLAPLLLSYKIGKISDKFGRKKALFLLHITTIAGLIFLFFSKEAIFLVIGILLLALNQAILKPVTQALTGDLSQKSNLSFVNMLFLIAQVFGVGTSFLISNFIKNKMMYIVSMILVLFSFFVFLLLFRIKIGKIKNIISRELK